MRVKYDTKVSEGCGEGMTCPDNIMLVMEVDLIWCGVQTSMTSCFGAVQLQEVVRHPRLCLFQTGGKSG